MYAWLYIYVYINSIHRNIGITSINLSLYVYMLTIYSHMYLRYIWGAACTCNHMYTSYSCVACIHV